MKQPRRFHPLILTAVWVGLVVSCGPDAVSSQKDKEGGDVSSVPAGSIAVVEINVDPKRSVYKVGMTPTITAKALGPSGKELEATSVEWSVDEDSRVERMEQGKWKFKKEGQVTFEACASREAEKRRVCSKKQLVVDAGPPTVQITSPEPGAVLGGEGQNCCIQVEGRVEDRADNLQVFVNGERAKVEGDGTFRAELEPKLGITHVEAAAFDGYHQPGSSQYSSTPHKGMDAVDVLWAPQYAPLKEESDRLVYETGKPIILKLGQRLLDDGRAQKLVGQSPGEDDVTGSGPVRIRDMAGLINLILQKADLTSRLDNPVVNTDRLRLEVRDIVPGRAQVRFDIVEDGLELFVTLPEFAVETDGHIQIQQQEYELDGKITGAPATVARLGISKTPESEELKVDLSEIDVTFQDLESTYRKKVDAVFSLTNSALRTAIEGLIVEKIEQGVIAKVPDVLSGVFEKINAKLADQKATIDKKLERPIEIGLDGNVESIDMVYKNAVTGVVDASFWVASGGDTRNAPGFPVVTGSEADESAPFFETGDVQLGVKFSAFNALLYGIWKAKRLDIDVVKLLNKQESPPGIVQAWDEIQLVPKLPPILTRPPADSQNDFLFTLGQFEVVMEKHDTGRVDRYGIFLQAGANVVVEGDKLRIKITEQPEITSWVESTEAEGGSEKARLSGIGTLIEQLVWRRTSEKFGELAGTQGEISIKEMLSKGISFNLPLPKPEGLARLDPSFSNFTFSFVPRRPLVIDNGYLVLDKGFQGQLPADSL